MQKKEIKCSELSLGAFKIPPASWSQQMLYTQVIESESFEYGVYIIVAKGCQPFKAVYNIK